MKKTSFKLFNRSKLLYNKSLKNSEKNFQITQFYKNSIENLCFNIGSIKKTFNNVAIISPVPHLFLNELPAST